MTEESLYTPPKVWKWQIDGENGGRFASINRPISGATHDKVLPRGKHPLQLYSLATPNGVKVTIMLEELLALGHSGAEYDAYLIDIMEGDQFGSDFVAINPNSKIPALLDTTTPEPTRVFESGSILLYLAEKFNALIPKNAARKVECMNWLFWQMGAAPYLGGGFGHFYAYAPVKIKYCIDRFAMEVKRQLDLLDKHLADKQYMCGDEYTIADIAIWPWYSVVLSNEAYESAEFLDAESYKQLQRWANEIGQRQAVIRGRKVNRPFGPARDQLHERHDASDFDTKTQDKLNPETKDK